jgi:hypothetical protein
VGLPVKVADIAPRLATGAFILNSGLSKRNIGPEHAAGLHGMASGAYPFLGKLDPQQFAKLLSAGEMTLMRKEGSLAPTQDGTILAKDVWMLGIGLGFVVDALANRKK